MTRHPICCLFLVLLTLSACSSSDDTDFEVRSIAGAEATIQGGTTAA